MPCQRARSCENPIEVTALPIPAEFCCLLRYFGTMPVSDSLSHPRAGVGGHRIAHLSNSWTRQGLAGSVTVLSFGAIPNHPTRYVAVLLVPSSLLGSDTYTNRHIRRLRPNREGSPPPSGHHGFTVRYGPEIWLSRVAGRRRSLGGLSLRCRLFRLAVPQYATVPDFLPAL